MESYTESTSRIQSPVASVHSRYLCFVNLFSLMRTSYVRQQNYRTQHNRHKIAENNKYDFE